VPTHGQDGIGIPRAFSTINGVNPIQAAACIRDRYGIVRLPDQARKAPAQKGTGHGTAKARRRRGPTDGTLRRAMLCLCPHSPRRCVLRRGGCREQ